MEKEHVACWFDDFGETILTYILLMVVQNVHHHRVFPKGVCIVL